MRKIAREVLRRKYGNKRLKWHYMRFKRIGYNYIIDKPTKPYRRTEKPKQGIVSRLKNRIKNMMNKLRGKL